jgi:hypothetical protein
MRATHRIVDACLLVCLIGGCQAGDIRERLDTRSGLTIVTEPAAMTFARTETQFSRSARDYVYVGPVEVNERGTRQYFLWVGVSSTIDRAFLGTSAGSSRVLYIDLDGVPIEFPLELWAVRVPGLADFDFYEPPVEPRLALAARVTRDQLALISRSGLDSLAIEEEDGTVRDYVLWDGAVPWPGFAAATGP